jgi:beta-aspartyl-peptidase (threonine type)
VSLPVVLVHGGAGPGEPPRGDRAEALRAGLERAVGAARHALRGGGSALDAAVAAVVVLEDDERFNAGRGSVLTETGEVEADATVMDGRARRAPR